MHIKKIRAKNFLSIGPEGIEVDFTKYGNIVLIKGQNLDISPQSSNGAGKCFGLNTPILMYDGTIKMVQDVRIGDLVMGDDSTPRTVLSLGRGCEMMYKVTPKKGASYIVNKSHILSLKCKGSSSRGSRFIKGEVTNVSVGDYLSESNKFRHMMGGYRASVDFDERQVKIDPYFLGLWLGDGNSHNAGITSIPETEKQDRRKHNSLLNDLVSYGLLNNKHIPQRYKSNSREVRLQLLAGLMDTDGSASKGGYDFVNKSKTLAEDVCYLARSLGLAAYMKECQKSCQTGAVGTYWRVFISGDCSIVPVRIPRKQCQPRTINKDPLVVGIKVEPIGVDDYYGFAVDGNHLFLLGDFTVVHNSTLIECIVYGLFGKLIKGLPHKEALNKKIKKKLEVEVYFDNFKAVRKRSPDSLEFYDLDKEDPEEPGQPLCLTLGGMPTTQAEIEKKIHLTYEAFINVVCFGEHNNHAFLAMKAEDKRTVVENLLGLDKYVVYCQGARKVANKMEADNKVNLKKYDTLTSQKKSVEERIKQLVAKQVQWRTARETEINALTAAIRQKREELNKSDDGNAILHYEQCQQRIIDAKDEIVKLEGQRAEIASILENEVQPKIDQYLDKKHDLSIKIKDQEHAIVLIRNELKGVEEQNRKMKTLENGVKCDKCLGTIDVRNYETTIKHNDNCIAHLKEKIAFEEPKLPTIKASLEKVEAGLVKLRAAKVKADTQMQAVVQQSANLRGDINKWSQVKVPNTGTKELLLNEQIIDLAGRLQSKEAELASGDPYDEIIISTEAEDAKVTMEILEVKGEIAKYEELLPYYEFWIKGFGDGEQSIRGFIIDEKLPALNARINYWLQFLIDNKLQVLFDKQFEPEISRNPPDGDPFVYNATSGGERRRINLAISQGFAHVTMLSNNACPSLISLDEVALNVDVPGVHGIYKMINELARERQVLVTTHDPNLLDLLENGDVIQVVKKDGFTTVQEMAKVA